MNILLVDHHPLMIRGVAETLRALEENVVTTSASSTEEALREFTRSPAQFDLVVMDLAIPGGNGLELIRELRNAFNEARVIVLSENDSRETVLNAFSAGAMGFVSKFSGPQVLIGAARLVLSGGIYIPRSVLSTTASRRSGQPPTYANELRLTERQKEVLNLLVEGKPNKLICRELNVSEGTVKTHVSAILRAFNLSNRTQVAYAINRLGLGVGPTNNMPEISNSG